MRQRRPSPSPTWRLGAPRGARQPSSWAVKAGTAAGVAVITAVLDAAMSAAVIVVVGRRDGAPDLGAYTAGTVGTSLAAIFLSLGTTFQYLTCTPDEQLEIRSLRANVTAPVLLATSLALAWFYSARGYSGPGVAFCGLAVALNNIAELQLVALQRELRFVTGAAVALLSKGTVVSLVVLGGRALPVSLLVGAIAQLGILEVVTSEKDKVRRAIERPSMLLWRRAIATMRCARAVGTYTVLSFAASRLDSFVLSIFATEAVTGRYGAMYSVYLAVVGIIYSALQVVIPLRRAVLDDDRLSHRPVNFVRGVCIGVGGAGAGMLAWQAERISRLVLGNDAGNAGTWLAVLAASLPFLLFNRSVAMESMARREYWSAARVVAVPAIGGFLMLAVAVPAAGAMGAAFVNVAQEAAGFLAIVVASLGAVRHRARKPTPSIVEGVIVGKDAQPGGRHLPCEESDTQ